MNRKRNFKTAMLLMLRKAGWLCKKPVPTIHRLRVKSTVWPDSRITPMQAEQHNWVESKKKYRKTACQFDSITFSCSCGIKSVEDFLQGCNNK